MFLLEVVFFYGVKQPASMQLELPRPNLVLDPRSNKTNFKFQCMYHDDGKTVTLTILEPPYYVTLKLDVHFRVYDPAIETVPSFTSDTYTYLGVDDERVPWNTTLLIIDPSVKIIKNAAAMLCKRIKKCLMHDGVHTIEAHAFAGCHDMKVIRLSRTLRRIGVEAFHFCESLEAVFLPSSLTYIAPGAFANCMSMRILPPPNINTSQIEHFPFHVYHTFFKTIHIQVCDESGRYYARDRIHQSIIDFYRNQPPLHKACLDTNVTALNIMNCFDKHGPEVTSTTDHDGMTPLHILAMNPHANKGAILACFYANMQAAFVGDSRGKSALEYLMEYHEIGDHTALVSVLCMHRNNNSQQVTTRKRRYDSLFP